MQLGSHKIVAQLVHIGGFWAGLQQGPVTCSMIEFCGCVECPPWMHRAVDLSCFLQLKFLQLNQFANLQQRSGCKGVVWQGLILARALRQLNLHRQHVQCKLRFRYYLSVQEQALGSLAILHAFSGSRLPLSGQFCVQQNAYDTRLQV